MLLTTSLFILAPCSLAGFQDDATAQAAVADLAAPVRLQAAGAPIDVTIGHAAPLVMDFDGDGVRDLLVGEYGRGTFAPERLPERERARSSSYSEGKLRIYRNVGTNDAPAFEDFEYLRAGKEYASIPTT